MKAKSFKRDTALGKLFYNKRNELEISAYKVALAAKVKRETLHNLEQGWVVCSRIGTVLAIAKVLNIDTLTVIQAIEKDLESDQLAS